MIEGARALYSLEGYIAQDAAIPSTLAADLARQVEVGIDAMAAELNVPRARYLEAVCRWSAPNPLVEMLVATLAGRLQPLASELLGARVRPGRASAFRKGDEASLGTHGHQDADYWVRPSSSRYHATTWVALDAVDEDSGALRVLPGSHRGAVAPPADYLATNFIDPAVSWGAEARTVVLPAGGAVTFDPKLWHASHPLAPDP